MQNSSAASLLEKSLPFYRVMRWGIAFFFAIALTISMVGELLVQEFDRTTHLYWLMCGLAYALTYAIQWGVEGEIERLREIDDD